MFNVHNMTVINSKLINYNFFKFQQRASRSNPSEDIDPIQGDATPIANDKNVDGLCELDIDSFVRTNIILLTISQKIINILCILGS